MTESATEATDPVAEPPALPFRQVNTSGATLHVPALGAEIGHGVEVEFHELLAGFTRIGHDLAAKSRRKAKKDTADDDPAGEPADTAESSADSAPEPDPAGPAEPTTPKES